MPNPMKPHPATLLGTAMHQVTEALLTGRCAGASAHLEMLEARVASLLEDSSRIGPVADWVMSRFGLRGLLSRRQLVEQANFARSLALRFASAGVRHGERITKVQVAVPIGSEKWLASSRLGIAGKVDLICREADRGIRIVDFKSGRIKDDDGSPKPAYLMQLAAYGRIAKDLEPETAVRLELVGKVDSWNGDFDAHLQAIADDVLTDLRSALPLGTPIQAETIASVGEHCGQCQYRPQCSRYNEALDERMASGAFSCEEVPPDVAGTLVNISTEGDLFTLKCETTRGYIMSICGVPMNMLGGVVPTRGAKLRAYGLGALEAKRASTFPCNFFVIDLETPRNSAFQVAVLVEAASTYHPQDSREN